MQNARCPNYFFSPRVDVDDDDGEDVDDFIRFLHSRSTINIQRLLQSCLLTFTRETFFNEDLDHDEVSSFYPQSFLLDVNIWLFDELTVFSIVNRRLVAWPVLYFLAAPLQSLVCCG